MKYFKLAKKQPRKYIIIQDLQGSLPKPKLPLCLLKKVHKAYPMQEILLEITESHV